METIFMNTENSKTNDSQKFVHNLSQRLEIQIKKILLFKTYLFITHGRTNSIRTMNLK